MDKENTDYDVIVIGAGINGVGIARDAAMRGLKVLLVDKGDIGGGTSSLSTRLIHGGLRYLEHGELRLVRESLREREFLMRTAPHLVRPLPLLVPVYKHARRGLWTVRAGMMAYDALSWNKSLPIHRMLSPAQTLQKILTLNPEGLLGAAVYFDAQVEFAERLVVENALSAMEHGATIKTYARVNKLIVQNGKACGIEFTGGPRGETQPARARIIINAAGPWVDHVLGKASVSSPRLIGGTKGSHIVVAPFADAPTTAIYVEAQADGRPFFIIPWNHKYLIGTTDIRFDGDPDQVRIESDEIDYLLNETNRVLPRANLTRNHILFAYSGVRPLPFTANRDEQNITRRHFIRPHAQIDNLFSIVGGKLTTYRSLAEQAVDLVFRILGRSSSTCLTDREPLPGATTSDFDAFCEDFKQRSPLSAASNDRLLRIYGTRSALIAAAVKEEASLAEVFDQETGALAAEVVFAFEHEFAKTLSNCLLRRTMVGLNSTCGLNSVEAAAAIAEKHLGWSEGRVEREIAEYRNEALRFRRQL
ncbi:MAG TPA: glycerol-3-phosphate dehydrogenase [Pyrinomonadaceae bacterium]|nr:glycerol-3-phosphate dehydrogenase [Pyrinomonadaceae bacterium]